MKDFKAIDEQIQLLNDRGMATNSTTGIVLLHENYYSVVNGY